MCVHYIFYKIKFTFFLVRPNSFKTASAVKQFSSLPMVSQRGQCETNVLLTKTILDDRK